jgi:repressor LexA
MMGLTERQKWAYDFIARRLRETAVAPTLTEISRHLGLGGKGSAHSVVTALVERGWLRRLPGRWRALELIERPARVKYFRFDDDTKQFVEWRP